MTRKDYIALAEVIAGEVATAGTPAQVHTASNIARSMADVFKRDNGRFDRETFYVACGLDETGGPVQDVRGCECGFADYGAPGHEDHEL